MKYKIGYTAGVFDLFHIGHLNLLEKCKNMCDYLIVGICDDEYCLNIKKKIPIFPEKHRLRILKALKCVDMVELVNYEITDNKMLAYEKFHFNVLFSGDDWKGSDRYKKTEEQFKQIGVSIEYLPYTKEISTTEIKERICKSSRTEW